MLVGILLILLAVVGLAFPFAVRPACVASIALLTAVGFKALMPYDDDLSLGAGFVVGLVFGVTVMRPRRGDP